MLKNPHNYFRGSLKVIFDKTKLTALCYALITLFYLKLKMNYIHCRGCDENGKYCA